jgi:hypothetical protein
MIPMRLVAVILLAGAIVHAQAPPSPKPQPEAARQTPPAPVVSPEVHADHRVTFRLRAPNAKEVRVEIEGASNSPAMRKDAEGVWSATSEPLAPDYYGYSFVVDGVTMFDPSNSATIPNFLYRASRRPPVVPATPPHLFGKSRMCRTGRFIITFTGRKWLAINAGISFTHRRVTIHAGNKVIPCFICSMATATTLTHGRRWAARM